MRALSAVNETGSFTRAAQRLHLTQSAISHQIRRLEEQVGRPLLHRTTRRLQLTEDGNEFLRHAEQILASFDALQQRFQSSRISGVVRFGVPEAFMSDRLPSLLAQFSRSFPAIRLDVSVSNFLDLQTMIRRGELDLAVVLSSASKLKGTTLQKTRFLWAAAETLELPRDGSLPFVLSPAPCVNRRIAVDALRPAGIEWHIVYTSLSQQGIRAAVLAGLGITVITHDELEPGMKILGREHGLPPLPEADYLLVWSSKKKTEAAVEFGKLLTAMSPPSARTRKKQQLMQ
ncbi:LysR substrate-binding domain-containing protein [Silvibacterium sp.]|uniref:LysR substrate-binding domain-containing protein n=1 Tax=Silvibacterium sp. TaxID=1964179 RepID=UPI0039E604C0